MGAKRFNTETNHLGQNQGTILSAQECFSRSITRDDMKTDWETLCSTNQDTTNFARHLSFRETDWRPSENLYVANGIHSRVRVPGVLRGAFPCVGPDGTNELHRFGATHDRYRRRAVWQFGLR